MLAYIPAAAFVPPTTLPAPTLTLVFASACTLIMLVASLQPQRLNVHAYKAMINTESAISYTQGCFLIKNCISFVGLILYRGHKRAQLDTSSMFHRRKPWRKLIDVAELGRNVTRRERFQ